MNGNLIIRNARIVSPLGRQAKKGKEMGFLSVVDKGDIIIESGKIIYAGASSDCPIKDIKDFEIIDAGGRVALPGFVDSHTHLIFGGYRPEEFEWRMNGDTYMSIMERGGGIQSTVNATRIATAEELAEKARWFIKRMSRMGVTTVEVKSGYGLDTSTEMKMIKAIDLLSEKEKESIRIVGTFLGAHAVPEEYKGRTDEYVDLMIKEMLPSAKEKVRFCDIFTEKNVFEIEESRRFMQSAKDMGYKLKFHADEIVNIGGSELAGELGAVSADHLLHISDDGVRSLVENDVVATLLPLTAFSLKEPYAPARKLIDNGAAVALATDLNPGSCFSGSIPLTIALACIYMNMSVEEVITALTLNGAAALELTEETGSLEEGKSGDVIILEFDNYKMLPYYVGMNCVRNVIYRGNIIV